LCQATSNSTPIPHHPRVAGTHGVSRGFVRNFRTGLIIRVRNSKFESQLREGWDNWLESRDDLCSTARAQRRGPGNTSRAGAFRVRSRRCEDRSPNLIFSKEVQAHRRMLGLQHSQPLLARASYPSHLFQWLQLSASYLRPRVL